MSGSTTTHVNCRHAPARYVVRPLVVQKGGSRQRAGSPQSQGRMHRRGGKCVRVGTFACAGGVEHMCTWNSSRARLTANMQHAQHELQGENQPQHTTHKNTWKGESHYRRACSCLHCVCIWPAAYLTNCCRVTIAIYQFSIRCVLPLAVVLAPVGRHSEPAVLPRHQSRKHANVSEPTHHPLFPAR